MSERSRGGCLRCGCLGCGGVLLLLLLVGGGTLGVAWLQRPDGPDPQDRRIEHRPAIVTAARDGALSDGDAGAAAEEVAHADAVPGTLELDLRDGSFEIVAGEAGTALEIQAKYDGATHSLEETFEEAADGSWKQTVRFGARLNLLFAGQRKTPRVRIVIPADLPVRLSGSIARGQSKLQLGGLDVRDVSLSTEFGQHEVRFSDPTRRPLERFELSGRFGQLEVSGLGHASPSKVSVSHEFGQLATGLSGAWRGGSEVDVSFRFGQCSVRAPENVNLALVEAHVDGGEAIVSQPFPAPSQDETGAEEVRLTATGFGGELRVGR